MSAQHSIPEGWEEKMVGSFLSRVQDSVSVDPAIEYQEIGIRSHGKGIFHKPVSLGEKIGNKSVFWVQPDCLTLNIVFAWEQAVARTTEAETGMIASHRFPMYEPDTNHVDLDFLLYFFKSKKGKHLLELASPGGAGRNKTLSKSGFATISVTLPNTDEQKKVAEIIACWDHTITLTERLLAEKELRRKGLMHQLLTGKRRLPGFFGEWSRPKTEEVFQSLSKKNGSGEIVLSVTQDDGIVPRASLERKINMDHANTHTYKLVEPGDFVISLRSFQGGLEYSTYKGLVSPAYHVIRPKVEICDDFYRHYFKSPEFIQRLAIATIGIRDGKQIGYKDFSIMRLPCPLVDEQHAIAKIINTADYEINLLKDKLVVLREQKKGLMQQLLTGKIRVKPATPDQTMGG